MLKKISFVFFFFFTVVSLFAQQEINTDKKGLAVDGYDVVAYFDAKVLEGRKKYKVKVKGVAYQFSSEENLQKFKKNPNKFIPQYGGWCAYAIAVKNQKVPVNPKTFEIRDGKLYLFYNAWGTNTLKLWKDEGAEKLRQQADENWSKE